VNLKNARAVGVLCIHFSTTTVVYLCMGVVFLTDFITVSVCRHAIRYALYLAYVPFVCFDVLKSSKERW
jgi:hypothetical protein